MSKEYDINIDWEKEFLDLLFFGVCGSVIDTETGRVRAATLSEVEEEFYRKQTERERKEMIEQIDKYYKHMEKKQPTRDSKGRFMKKENKKAFDYEGTYKQQKEVIADLKKESECYKELAERMSSNYLNKCAEYGELKRELEIYKEYFPKMKKIAKLWKQKAELRLKGLLFYSDAVIVMEKRLNWLEKSVPWYKRICLNRKKVEKFNALYDEYIRLLDSAHKFFE